MKAEKTTLELVKLCMEKWRICNISSEVAYQCKWHVFLYSKVKKKKYFQQAVFVSFVVFLNNTRVLRILSERTTKNQEEGAAQSLACPRQLWVISSEISPSAEAADSNQSHPKGKRFLKDKLCKIWQKLEWGWGKAWSFMFFAFYNCCFLSKVAKFIEFRVQSSSAAPPHHPRWAGGQNGEGRRARTCGLRKGQLDRPTTAAYKKSKPRSSFFSARGRDSGEITWKKSQFRPHKERLSFFRNCCYNWSSWWHIKEKKH